MKIIKLFSGKLSVFIPLTHPWLKTSLYRVSWSSKISVKRYVRYENRMRNTILNYWKTWISMCLLRPLVFNYENSASTSNKHCKRFTADDQAKRNEYISILFILKKQKKMIWLIPELSLSQKCHCAEATKNIAFRRLSQSSKLFYHFPWDLPLTLSWNPLWRGYFSIWNGRIFYSATRVNVYVHIYLQ